MPTSYENDSIDWPEFYRQQGVGKLKRSGSKHTGLCPLHDNSNTPAFWFTTANGMWKCEAGCGQGNPTQFLALRQGITTGEADKLLCEIAGIRKEPAKPRKAAGPQPPYDVAAYAAEKGFNPAKLAEWGVTASRNIVSIPYTPGEPGGAVRKRSRPGSSKRFAWATEKVGDSYRMVGALALYGLWRLPEWDGAPIVLVEGESDAHALWSLGIPALGVPGASTFRPEWAEPLAGHDLLLHNEGDDGAATFISHTATSLHTAKFSGSVRVFATPTAAKDPSDLFFAHGATAANMLTEAISAAESLELASFATDAPTAGLLGAYGLKCPRGWKCDDAGVRHWNEEMQTSTLVTTTPVVITGRIVDAASGNERVRLGFKRGARFHEVIADRADAFSTRNVVGVLAPLGAQITSENARKIVQWLGGLEQTNMDAIKVVESARELGWCGPNFMPTNGNGLLLDLPPGAEDVIAAFTARGNRDEWFAAMDASRAKSPVLRFMLAAGVASTLLKATGGRIFFVYNWGSSRGGKTAAIKAALSAWGDPEVLMTTFNATHVGLERRAALFRDLPLGIDERQAAVGDQRSMDSVVMSLASGTGRVRGARDGGLQAQAHWRTVVLATGEEPLSGSTSKTGVSTRVLEVFGSPFESEEDAAAMHRLTACNHGHLGPAFVEQVIKLGDSTITALQDTLLSHIEPYGKLHASSHLAGIATVLAADVLLSTKFFGLEYKEAMRQAEELGLSILGRVEIAKAGDVDEAALLFIEDWLHGNEARFVTQAFSNTVFGEKRGTSWLVFPSALREGLESSGFSYRKTLRALMARDAVKIDAKGGCTTSQRVYNSQKRVVWIDETKLGAEQEAALFDESGVPAPAADDPF